MQVTDDLKSLITNGASLEEIEKQAIKDGKTSLAQNRFIKYLKATAISKN